jgi:lathosterol oxidase
LKKMDVILNYADNFLLTPYIYPSSFAEDNPLRQIISLFLVTNVGGYVLYFIAATLSYVFIFDKRQMRKGKYTASTKNYQHNSVSRPFSSM